MPEERRGSVPDSVAREAEVLAKPGRILARKCLTVFAFLFAAVFMGVIFIGLEYENDHNDR